jgi:uncharacterized phage protein (TIGR02218 family)
VPEGIFPVKTAVSSALLAHFSQGQTTTAWILKVKRTDGTIFGFTTHDQPIGPYTDGDGDTVTYLSKTALKPSGEQSKSDLSVDNLETLFILDSTQITDQDIRGHLYDDAVIELRVVNWADLTMGDLYMRKGTLGVVKMINGQATSELRGMSYRLSTPIGETTGPICRATFGSGLNGIDLNSKYLCHFDVTQVRQTGYVADIIDRRTLIIMVTSIPTIYPGHGAPIGYVSSWFNDGILIFTSGALNGQALEIKSGASADIILEGTSIQFYIDIEGKLPRDAATYGTGDTVTIEAGCNKTIFDCQNKYSNILNFRGEPFIPGMDSMLDYPDANGP